MTMIEANCLTRPSSILQMKRKKFTSSIPHSFDHNRVNKNSPQTTRELFRALWVPIKTYYPMGVDVDCSDQNCNDDIYIRCCDKKEHQLTITALT